MSAAMAKEYDRVVWRLMLIAFSIWFAVSMTLLDFSRCAAQTSGPDGDAASDAYSAPSSGAAGYTPDQRESQALSEYLKQRKLPLVGAQVLKSPDGKRMVVLYGFVGSDYGKSDATKKARRFLKDSSLEIDNRINVRPELLASNKPSMRAEPPGSGYPSSSGSAPSEPEDSSAPRDDSSAYPGAQSYSAQRANPYAQQLSSLAPLIALLGVLGMGLAGGNSGFSFGSSPFGSPYSSPYSNPYGPSYSGSPYGASPYGASPYGPPYTGPSGRSPYAGSPYAGSPYGGSPYGPPPYP
jgi:hypothetical protein